MPYIDTTPALFRPKVREDNIQDAIAELLTNHGWTLAKKFRKAVCSAHLPSNMHPISARHWESFAVSQHYIFRNSDAKMFGIAVAAQFDEYTDHENIMPYYDWATGTPEEKEAFIKWLDDKFDENKANTSLYFYMVERVPDFPDNQTVLVPYAGYVEEVDKDSDPYSTNDKKLFLRMSLDVEVVETDYDSSGNPSSLYIKKAVPMVMQSPICKCTLRPEFVENISYPTMHTNWWSDSEISVRGYIDSANVFFVLMADNVPAWESNLVPTIPFYFGNIVPLDEGDEAVALFTGTVPPGVDEESVATFDFNNIERAGERIMPILKNYPKHPSNGVDSVMLSRSKYGARYQEYFLSWNTAPNDMAPLRETADGRQYPRAYNNINSSVYKYQFSPSRYSNKVHTSRVYLVHPEEGVRGYLTRAIGLSSVNFTAGKLRVRKENCPEKIYDVYRYMPIGALSPLTKRPGTPYRPMGLGIYEVEYNPNKPEVEPDPNDTTPPGEVTILSAESVVTETIDISWQPPEDEDFSHINIYLNDDTEPYVKGVVGVEKYRIAGLKTDQFYTVRLTTVDINGNESDGVTTSQIKVV